MNFEYFFARRIAFRQQRSISSLVVKLALVSIALAVATMEISLSVVQGFETEIQKKVIGFGSHIQVGNYYRSIDVLENPLPRHDPTILSLDSIPNVISVFPYISSPAMCKSETELMGVQLKGVSQAYDLKFFRDALQEGALPDLSVGRESLEILISRKQANGLDVALGDRLRLFFQRDSVVKQRRVTISGIYESGMEEFDAFVMLCDMRMLQNIRNWSEEEVTGFEVNLATIQPDCGLVVDLTEFPGIHWRCHDPLMEATDRINASTPFNYGAEPITFLYPEIFDWLRLQHQNVWFILILMMIVAVINMSSVMLILIIERTTTIGILKALGLNAFRSRRLFVAQAFYLIALGVLFGNLLGLGILWSQASWEWLKVNQESYFIRVVPVAWVWARFFLVNVGVIVICTLFMYIPTYIITRIQPAQAIRFD